VSVEISQLVSQATSRPLDTAAIVTRNLDWADPVIGVRVSPVHAQSGSPGARRYRRLACRAGSEWQALAGCATLGISPASAGRRGVYRALGVNSVSGSGIA
jgi:hypothetical protein